MSRMQYLLNLGKGRFGRDLAATDLAVRGALSHRKKAVKPLGTKAATAR